VDKLVGVKPGGGKEKNRKLKTFFNRFILNELREQKITRLRLFHKFPTCWKSSFPARGTKRRIPYQRAGDARMARH
jgi:hypothetical protein